MSKKIVKELLTKWTYQVDTKQLAATVKLIKSMKSGFTDVKKSSVAFGKGEFKRIDKIRKGWKGLSKQVTNYRNNLSQMPRGGNARGGGRGRGRGKGGGGGRGGVGGLNSAAFLAGRMAGNSALTSALLGGAGLAGGFAAAGAVKAAGNRESSEVRFASLLGDKGEATKLLDSLSQFARTTPFALTQLRKLAQQTLGGGFNQKEIIPLLTKLGNVTQGDSVALNRMLTNMIEIKNVGAAFTRDIRQFGRAGIPIFPQLMKDLDVSGMQLDALITSGKIGFKEVERALINMTSKGAKFYKNMADQMKTFNGQLNNLGDTITSAGEKLGKPFLKPLTAGIKAAGEFLGPFAENLAAGVTGIKNMMNLLPEIKGWGTAIGLIFAGAFASMAPMLAGFTALLLILEDYGVYLKGGDSLIGRIIGKPSDAVEANPKLNKAFDAAQKARKASGGLLPHERLLKTIKDKLPTGLNEIGNGILKGIDLIPAGFGSISNQSNQSFAANTTINMAPGGSLSTVMSDANQGNLELMGRQSKPTMIS